MNIRQPESKTRPLLTMRMHGDYESAHGNLFTLITRNSTF